ncbi:MAG: helix-turn-helix transcriptional regulator [Elusimicrobia bacterium]|nr:helix-turn-helix transcriptional regulator [Elusimicrobiota bacterium]
MQTFIPHGKKIQELRKALPDAPSQETFSSKVGIHRITLANIETSKYHMSFELAKKIASLLGVAITVIAEEKFAEVKKKLPPDEDIQEIASYFLEHQKERNLILGYIRGAKGSQEAFKRFKQLHQQPKRKPA